MFGLNCERGEMLTFAVVGTNITANSISAANDLTVLFPRYVNIERGCIIAAIIGGVSHHTLYYLVTSNSLLANFTKTHKN